MSNPTNNNFDVQCAKMLSIELVETIFFAEKLARRNVSCTGNPEMVADYATRLEVFIHEMKAIRPELMPLDGLYNHVMCQISHLDRLVLKMKSYLN